MFRPRGTRPGQGSRATSIALLLLLHELYRGATVHGIPPVTLSTIIGQILVYLRVFQFPWNQNPNVVCVSANKVIQGGDYAKLFLAQIEHGDDWHLYYNMISFMWKGKTIESHLGPTKYILLLLLFTGATGLTYVGLNVLLGNILDDPSYIHRCSVGFSGVIFALKVLTTHYAFRDGNVNVGGISVPSKYGVWVELILISLVTPNASFIGHLAGILVGLAYVYGPLRILLDTVHGIFVGGPSVENQNTTSSSSHRFTSTSQRSGYRLGSSNSQYYSNMSEEEQIRRAMEENYRANANLRNGRFM